jgi:hypothetical protein
MMKKGNGLLSMLAVLMLFVSVSAGAVSAAQADSEMSVEENTGDIGILATIHLGSMSTDGDGNTASVAGVGCVTAPAGQNTFTATYSNDNDRDNDGQGAIYRLTVWDALGVAHTTEKRVDWATSGTISVTFNSQGSGDAQYELWCETHDWFDTTMAVGGPYIGDLDFA